MTHTTRTYLVLGLIGGAFGFSIGMIGFGDFGELNAMFTFQDLRMLLAFAGAVAVAAVGFALAGFRPGSPPAPRIHAGVVPGAVLFGAGWAVCGGCPSIPIVQLGTGYLPAAVTLAGIVVGMRAYRAANARWLRFDTGSCGL